MVKSVCKHCMVCRKALAKTIIQFMGDLPDHRISPARPFDYTEVDFADPFDVKRGHTRKPVLVKAYACLFVCMSTKAVHIDCTEDLSTASFMLCFEHFINRRGFPQYVYSDNGSNFIGAARTLGTPTQLPYDLQDFTAKTADLQAHGVSWHFIPARSPHCGGIWESGIRRMKEELRKTLHHFTPTAAEFHHLLITAACPEQQVSATHLSGRSRRCSSHHSWTLFDWETHQDTPSRHPTTQRWTQESHTEPAQS